MVKKLIFPEYSDYLMHNRRSADFSKLMPLCHNGGVKVPEFVDDSNETVGERVQPR